MFTVPDLNLLDNIARHAASKPGAVALGGDNLPISYGELWHSISEIQMQLPGKRVALLLDNHPAWAILDIALLQARCVCVPIPPFFSPSQLHHVLEDAGIDTVITDQPQRFADIAGEMSESLQVAGKSLHVLQMQNVNRVPLDDDVIKITYTSGTTGEPKGVCLDWSAIQLVIDSLSQACEITTSDTAMALLPLSTLLENIGSVYVPLQAGACAVLPASHETGISGSSQVSVATLLACLHRYQPTGLILIPQLLQLLVQVAEAGQTLPGSFRFLAVGGAPVATDLLIRAERQQLPVYQGYGLSEAASVVCLNTPADNRPGSVGKPLPHLKLRIADTGEVILRGHLFRDYLGKTSQDNVQEWPTGDIGHLDDDGYLYLTGRRKNMFITSFGRNVSPEWVECELQSGGSILQAAVFGEARPFNVAVFVPHPGSTDTVIRDSVRAANNRLPDYARIRHYVISNTAFTVENGLLTGTSRVRRDQVAARFNDLLKNLYEDEVA
jgi:long-subunit acyl-CoA synthetase (AMP-forming)